MKGNKLMIILLALVVIAGGAYYGYRQMYGVQKTIVDATEQGQKIEKYANPDAFITPMQLKDLMDRGEDVVVIGSLNPTAGNPQIEGSFAMWRDSYSAANGVYPFGGMRAEHQQMEAILSSFGATDDSTIVVYASNHHYDATRVYWQIKMLGHKDVRYLDGGLNAWIGAGYPTASANPTVEATKYKGPKVSEEMLASLDDVVAAINDDKVVIVDTRYLSEHNGSETLKGAFGPGKIPGSVWIAWEEAVNEDTTLKSLDELKAIYGDLKGKKIITFCQSGVRSSHTLLVLKEVLGYENVLNYDGSWIEWSYEHYEKQNAQVLVENGK